MGYNELMSDQSKAYHETTVNNAPLTGIAKYKNTIALIEEELYTTLNYLNNQLDLIDDQTGGNVQLDEHDAAPKFNRNVYDSKKQIAEQKLVTLRMLASIAAEQIKITEKDKGDTVSDITSLFQN